MVGDHVLLCSVSDPPSPDASPNITSISHNSVKVEFSGFEASHGPIKAYALILTTGNGKEGSVMAPVAQEPCRDRGPFLCPLRHTGDTNTCLFLHCRPRFGAQKAVGELFVR